MSATKRHRAAEWASRYKGLPAELPPAPVFPRPPKKGHAWTIDGEEVRLMRGRRKAGEVAADTFVTDAPTPDRVAEEDAD